MSGLSAPRGGLTAATAKRRFLVLTALRWLPSGLVIPVVVLLPLDRGLSVAQFGLAAATQGLVVFALELPTGGLADAVGRRPVLIVSVLLAIASMGLLLIAHSLTAFVIIFALQGIYRALDSGPLEAWFVDTARAADPAAPIDKGLSARGTVLGLAIAGGSLVSGGLVAIKPIPGLDPLLAPVILALVLQVIGLIAIWTLMVETRASAGLRGLASSARGTGRAIAEGVGLLRRSRVLLALVGVELFWGFSMVCFESLMPVRLAQVAGGTEAAAAITGPALAAAWIASAAGSMATPKLGQWLGMAPTAALMRVLQGITVAGLGFFGGVVGIVAAFIACYAIHGTSNAAHMTLVHQQADDRVRATVLSLNSWVSQPASAIGLVTLTAVAQATSVSLTMYVGGFILALAAPLYLPAWRQSRVDSAPAPRLIADGGTP